MAPEILKKGSYDQQVDVWSAGIIVFYLLFGSFPFTAKNKVDLFYKI